MLKMSIRALLGCLILLLPPGNAFASQPLARDVFGIVTDRCRKPVKGAVVQLEDMNLLGVRSYITQADGKFHFPNLSLDDDYRLRAAFHGSEGPSKIVSHFDSPDAKAIHLRVPVTP